MSLLDQEVKKQEPKGKKIVLFLLIFCVFALIMVIVMMMALPKEQQSKGLSMSINDQDIAVEIGMFATDENGVNYISIQKIATPLGYDYLTGEYQKYNEDTTNTKCYLESINQVIQFEEGTNKIYKINPNSNLDYEEYELKYKILKQNNILYIALNDINIALNVTYSYSQNDNKYILKTIDELYKEYETDLSTKSNGSLTGISDNFNNKKAIAYDMLVVSNSNGKWGVVNTSDFSTIIGNKYSSIEFVESADVFIVSDNGKYGLINKDGLIVKLNYDNLKIINNNPLSYEIKIGEKSAILNKEGKAITINSYDSIGYSSEDSSEKGILVIEKIEDNEVNLLVVCKDGKYGLLDLDNGNAIGECIIDRIYSKIEDGEKTYYIQYQEQEILLKTYIEKV